MFLKFKRKKIILDGGSWKATNLRTFSFFLFIAFLNFAPISAFGQDQSSFSSVQRLDQARLSSFEDSNWYFLKIDIPDFGDPFISLTIKWEDLSHSPAAIIFKKLLDGSDVPIEIIRDAHLGNDSTWISQLQFFSKEHQNFELFIPLDLGSPKNITLHWFYPGEETAAPARERREEVISESCFCPIPEMLNRSQWCPHNNCPSFVFSTNNSPTHLIVHHTAGTNQSTNWSAVVRSIWNQHVNINGWSDIGYHYLIDPDGVIYQGRTDEQVGAHFCATNSSTLGICVMGNFDLLEPAEPALYSLLNLVAGKSCEKMIHPVGQSFHPPSGLALNHISGHRDGCATQCPGAFLYPLLPGLRRLTEDKFQWICMNDLPVPIWKNADLFDDMFQLEWEYEPDPILFNSFELQWRPLGQDQFFPLVELDATQRELTFQMPSQEEFLVRIRAVEKNVKSDWSEEKLLMVSSLIGHHSPKNKPLLFPNPAKNEIFLFFPPEFYTGEMNGFIFDHNGRKVQHIRLIDSNENPTKFDVMHLPDGFYFIELEMQVPYLLPFVLKKHH